MLSKFNQNSILVGQVEAFCLVCESYLRTEESVNTHVKKPLHKNNLDTVGYFQKYKDDYIRKVKKGYFCGFCNALLPTAAKVGLHINEPVHNDNKGAQLLKRQNSDVVAYDIILIKGDAWHGLIEDTCVICNIEFDDINIHKNEHTHVLKLIQNKVQFGAGRNIYRKIDEDSYQCLTCNSVLSASSFTEHFNSNDHKQTYKKSEITADKSAPITGTDSKAGTTNTIIINKNVESTIPRKQNGNEVDSKESALLKDEDEVYCKVLGAENYIIIDNTKDPFCIICHTRLDSSFPTEKHINSDHHQTMLKLHKERHEKKRKNSELGSEEIETVVEDKLVIVNDKQAKSVKDMKGDVRDVTTKDSDNKTEILESVTEFQKNNVNIDLISETAYCKKCVMNVGFDVKAINDHIADHGVSNKKGIKVPLEHGVKANGENKNLFTKPVLIAPDKNATSAVPPAEDIRTVAKNHGMTFRGKELYCNACESVVSAKVKSIEGHVCGRKHKVKMVVANTTGKNKKISKQKIEEFVKGLTVIEDENQDAIINETFCIMFSNFMFIGRSMVAVMCLACNSKLSNNAMLAEHLLSPRHEAAMKNCYVITSFDNEFVREVNQIYQCGFCNYVEKNLDVMEEHLNSSEHKRTKIVAEWKLKEHLAEIRAHRVRKQIAYEMASRMWMAHFSTENFFNGFNFNTDADSD